MTSTKAKQNALIGTLRGTLLMLCGSLDVRGVWRELFVIVVLATKLCLTLCDSMNCSPSGSSVHGIFQQEYWSGLPFPSPGGLSDPGIEPTSSALAGRCFSTEPPWKPVTFHELPQKTQMQPPNWLIYPELTKTKFFCLRIEMNYM